jgi:two-component system, NtrC family, response regulator AtoC
VNGGNVLVVDDDPAVGLVLRALLEQAGLIAEHVTSGHDALEAIDRRPIDVVISDLRMPAMDGLTLLRAIRERDPSLPVVMLTAHGTVPDAVEAMRAGATDFLLKPFDKEEIVFVVQKALTRVEADAESSSGGRLIAAPVMSEVEERIRRAASTSATVLVLGESGTGKERVARRIHEASAQRNGPFVAVHCAAIPETLLESELFGYEKGAFTGAAARKPGRVELAAKGTLFLDEIGDLPAAVQVKLLRLLQERTYERLGGTETFRADVRFVAATHRDLHAAVAAGSFREDLYYRLAVVPIELPPLRTRVSDIEQLARRFCAEHAASHNRDDIELDDDAIALLRAEPWPGNIRQLQNFIERLVVLCDPPRIRAADVERELGRSRPAPSGVVKLDTRRREAERDALREALSRAGNNRTLAARILGVSRRTLYNKLAELDL